MWDNLGMPTPKKPCPTCGQPMSPKASQCRRCKPSYERTDWHRQIAVTAQLGVPKSHTWRTGRPPSTRPEVAQKIREAWTPEKREEARHRLREQGVPEGTYPGLSHRRRGQIREEAGVCQRCGAEGRLHTHHRDLTKTNQDRENLLVLCARCHAQQHAAEQRAMETPTDRRFRNAPGSRWSR